MATLPLWRSYPLSIVVVRIGDGPWEDMKNFGDELRARKCQNFQMVNRAEIISTNATFTEQEIAFALTALMEIPFQYKAAVEIGILGRDRQSRANRSTPSTSSSNLSALFVLQMQRSWPLAVGTWPTRLNYMILVFSVFLFYVFPSASTLAYTTWYNTSRC